MLLELHDLFNIESYEIKIDYDLDLSQLSFNNCLPFVTDVKVFGSVKNVAGVVELNAIAQFTLSLNCDRCAESFERDYTVPCRHTLVTELYDESRDDLVLVEDMQLNLDELITSDILLDLPTKFLCKEDCKGICLGCGKNLNLDSCTCKKEIDPRLQVLMDLLNDDNQ